MTTQAEAITSAGEVYGAILADPERREQLRRARAAKAPQPSAQPAIPRPAGRTSTRRTA